MHNTCCVNPAVAMTDHGHHVISSITHTGSKSQDITHIPQQFHGINDRVEQLRKICNCAVLTNTLRNSNNDRNHSKRL